MTDFSQPDQQFSLQEVAQHCGLAPYIIRYWEIHFPQLAGQNGSTKSTYSSHDVALIWRIKKLLYVDHLTIDQAKAQLATEQAFPVQYPGTVSATYADAPESKQQEATQEVSQQATEAQQPQSVDSVVCASDCQQETEQSNVCVACKDAHSDVATQDESVNAQLAELQQLRARVQELTSELAVLRDARESLTRENQELKQQLQRFETAHEGMDSVQSSLAQENAQLKTTVQDVISQLKQMSSGLARN